jgi:prepilin-type N-terminal cleavage/methylation domain-containing protein
MKNKRAFTLIELLLVMAVIATLASVVFVSLGSARDKANEAKTKVELAQMKKLVEIEELSTGSYSTALDNLFGEGGQYEDMATYELDNNDFCLQYTLGGGTYCIDSNNPAGLGTCEEGGVCDFNNLGGGDEGDEESEGGTDDCDNAQNVNLVNKYYYNTTEATPSVWPGDGLVDVWFSYNSDFTGTLVVDVCDSNFDTYLEVYSDCCCSGTLISSNDDACGFSGVNSRTSLSVVNGETYFIRISGYDSSEIGRGHLNLYEDPGSFALVCPSGGINESEFCGDNDNGEESTAISIVTGDTICGNLWAGYNVRDVDWFEIELLSQGNIKIDVISEESVQIGMVNEYNGRCFGSMIDYSFNYENCFNEYEITPAFIEDSVEFVDLSAGTYYFILAPAFYDGDSCPGFDYQISFTINP